MSNVQTCQICHGDLMENDRVIFSARDTFVFKPAHVPDEPVVIKKKDGTDQEVNAAAMLGPDELRERRKEHLRTAVVNHFVDWGRAQVPEGAFYFRHQWCEPVRTGAGGTSAHSRTKHAIRFSRRMPGRMHG